MTETILEKIQKLKEEWMQFKSNVNTLMTTTQTAIDNANKTMDEIQKTLETIQQTMDSYDGFINELRDDYNRLKVRVEEHIKKHRWWW
jgi:uncharacterized coiled-coil DUF342 family protein